MPLKQPGLANYESDIDQKVKEQIDKVFSMLDRHIGELSRTAGLSLAQVKLLQPLHKFVLVGDVSVFVALSVHEIGAVSAERFKDWPGKPMNMATAIFLVERDLGFKDPFGFQFDLSLLNYDDDQKEEAVARIAERCIKEEIANVERQERLVRISPIFQGREFLINEHLVFVLSPFEEPFDTIYEDHIRPSIESIGGLSCLRADDIYDNRPIIEDIWRCTNEARILIAELTGRNPNVFYETGIAHTVGKEVILITQSMEDVPFDLKHLRCIVYEYTPRGTKALEENLKNTVLNILARPG